MFKRREEIEVSVGGPVDQFIADLREASATLRKKGVKEVYTEMSTETVPYSDGRHYPVFCVYGVTSKRA